MRAMTKKLLSALVVLAMVLSMVPVVGLPAITANAAASTADITAAADALMATFAAANAEVTDNNYATVTATCPHCNASVSWRPLTTGLGGTAISTSGHYYIAKDFGPTTSTILRVTGSANTSCLHLNGKTITSSNSSYAFHAGGSATLNIMGQGTVNYTGAGIGISLDKSYLNLYGGTYNSTSATLLQTRNGTSTFRVHFRGNTTLNGEVGVGTPDNQKYIFFYENATATSLTLDAKSKVQFAKGWTGTVYNLTKDAASTIEVSGTANGTVYMGGQKYITSGGELVLDTSGEGGETPEPEEPETPSQAPTETTCPACGAENVVWTELKGYWGKVAVASGHYYISENFDTETAAEDGTWEFFRPSSTTTVCLHLNGQNITSKGRFYIGNASTLNIMGTGSITYDGTSAQLFQIQTTYLNLYGGTYSCKDSTKDVIYLGNTGQPHLHNDTYIKGKISWQDTKTAKVFAYDSAKIDAITVPSTGKLTLAAGWQGTIGSLTAPVENGLIPAANAEAKDATLGGTITASTGENVIVDETTGQLKLDIAVAAKIGNTEYATAQLAVDAATASDVVVLLANATIEIAEGKTVTVDANGKNVTVTGAGTLKAIDSANDDYNGCGTWTISNVTNWVTEANGGKYVLLAEETAGTYTAHRLDIRISAVNLRTNSAGLYYTAEYKCDAALAAKVKTYGVALSLNAIPTALANSAYTAIETATKPLTAAGTNTYNTNSGAVVNILSEGNAENAANAIKAVKANAYLEINTGANDPVVVMGIADTDDGASYSLADVLDTINDGWNETWMIEAAKTLVAQFYKKWSAVFEAVTGFDFTNIANKANSL